MPARSFLISASSAFERTAGDGVAAEGGDEHVPLRFVVCRKSRANSLTRPRCGLVQDRLERGVVEAELLEVGEDREGDRAFQAYCLA